MSTVRINQPNQIQSEFDECQQKPTPSKATQPTASRLPALKSTTTIEYVTPTITTTQNTTPTLVNYSVPTSTPKLTSILSPSAASWAAYSASLDDVIVFTSSISPSLLVPTSSSINQSLDMVICTLL